MRRISLVFAQSAQAKVLPRFQTGTKSVSSVKTTSGRVGVSVKFRGDRHAILVNFSNLTAAKSVSYTLSYQTNGKNEGVAGTIRPQGTGAMQRELLFGTCSSGVCRYHSNITNAKLEVTSTLNSGQKVIKRFRLKV